MKQKQKILIVDDVELNRSILKGILGDSYIIDEASDGEEAYSILTEHHWRYQLVLLDLHMPKMDGYELLKRMNEHQWIEELPVIIISSDNEYESMEGAYRLGVSDYIPRPFHSKTVMHRVEHILRQYERNYKDLLSGAYNKDGFVHYVTDYLCSVRDVSDYAILIFSLKNFNFAYQLRGVEGKSSLLKNFFQKLEEAPFEPIIAARVGLNECVAFVKKEKLEEYGINNFCQQFFTIPESGLQLQCRCGIYYIETKEMPVLGMINKARIAKEYIRDEYAKPYMIFEKSMQIDYVDRAELAAVFDHAITNEEFQVFYQPIMDVKDEKIVSAEALIRWNHPERSEISPIVFIPTLEKNGFVSKLDDYVMRKVKELIDRRHEQKKKMVPISVNLSWMDFYDETMLQKLVRESQYRKEEKVPVRFEITETSYAAIAENRSIEVKSLRDAGSIILLDDFGSGYSSFQMLQNYNFDILKIDMAFIRQIETNQKTRSIVQAIINMAHKLGIKVVAEGVETEEQVTFLRNNECDYVQGYYYSKPVEEERFIQLLDQCEEG